MQPWKVLNNCRKFAAMSAVNERSAASHSMSLFRIAPKRSFEKALYFNALFYFRVQVRDPQPARGILSSQLHEPIFKVVFGSAASDF